MSYDSLYATEVNASYLNTGEIYVDSKYTVSNLNSSNFYTNYKTLIGTNIQVPPVTLSIGDPYTSNINELVILVDTENIAASINIILPNASSYNICKKFTIKDISKKADIYNINVFVDSGFLENEQSSIQITTASGFVTLISSPSNNTYYIINAK